MPPRVRIVEPHAIDSVHWPTNDAAAYARRYLLPFMTKGAQHYIDNVTAAMFALIVDGVVLPTVVAQGNYSDSNVSSIYSHYVKYPLDELRRLQHQSLAWGLKMCLLGLGVILKAGRVDRVVYVNNWLFATNPCPDLTSDQIAAITAALTRRFPDHAVVIRSVNRRLYQAVFTALEENGYRMVRSREIYVLDPRSKAYATSSNVKRDLSLLYSGRYEIVGNGDLGEDDVSRLTELYRALYLRKHSFFNPQLNDNFFRLTLKGRIFSFKALRRDGRIDGFVCYYRKDRVVTGAFIGYDTGLPAKAGLLRQAFALLMAEAAASGHLLHLSAGVGAFKMLRGAAPAIEYDAVYDRHLPGERRLAWRCLRSCLEGWERAVSMLLSRRRPFPARRPQRLL